MAPNVHTAMAEDRPEKRRMRELWAEQVDRARQREHSENEPLLLTLCGAKALDIDDLLERGIVQETEVGGIATEDARAVVAVESSPDAVVEILRKYPGLKVIEMPIRNLLHSESDVSWPTGEMRAFCRAGVVNLDLDEPLVAALEDGEITFPVLEWIRKFAVLHGHPPRREWTLCLTLHGEILWDESVARAMQTFLDENFEESSAFAEGCRDLFGQTMFDRIRSNSLDFGSLNRPQQQKILMAFVPKRISYLTFSEGWLVRTVRNLRYGGQGGRAPMVTWIMDFVWDERVNSQPLEIYRESVGSALQTAGVISKEGELE